MSSSDDDPHPANPAIDLNEFFFPGTRVSALLVHGLSGTPFEMRYLGDRLATSGVRVCGVRLAGHGGAPEELGSATHAQWYESVVEGFERLHRYGDPVAVVGLSMGAVLAARLAADQGEAVAGVVMLSSGFFLPLWVRAPLKLGAASHRSSREVAHSSASRLSPAMSRSTAQAVTRHSLARSLNTSWKPTMI